MQNTQKKFKLHSEYNWYNSDFYSDYWEGC